MPHLLLLRRARTTGVLALVACLAPLAACTAAGSEAAGEHTGAPDPAPTAVGAPGPQGSDAGPSVPAPVIDDTTPEGAVAGFLAAEGAGAFDASFALLGSEDRERIPSPEEWRDQHAGRWPIAGGEVTGVQPQEDQATVTTTVRFHSGIDETVGLVPARAEVRWRAVSEGDRWRIALAGTTVTPAYPDDAAAPARVRDWAAARQACRPAPEYDGGLVGVTGLADRLCRHDGDVEVGATEPLREGPDADPFVAAFGPEALEWARVVAIRSPVALRAVVAPVADSWTVVGVLDAPAAP
jgi:hypothetical protein